jgi:hypothetical protein
MELRALTDTDELGWQPAAVERLASYDRRSRPRRGRQSFNAPAGGHPDPREKGTKQEKAQKVRILFHAAPQCPARAALGAGTCQVRVSNCLETKQFLMKRSTIKREGELEAEVDDLRRQLAAAQATIRHVRDGLGGKPARLREVETFDLGLLPRSKDYPGSPCGRCRQPVNGASIFNGLHRFHPNCHAAYQAERNAAVNGRA